MSGILSGKPMRGVLMPPAQAPDNAMTQAFALYPALSRHNLAFINSSGQQSKYGGGSETYNADESESPLKGRNTIEQFDPNMTAQGFMGEALHVLPNLDPKVMAMKQAFLQSMTPQQLQKMQSQYAHEKEKYGESRPFDKWKEISGNDAWFRGRITGQWPDSVYTPQQLQMFDELKSYLQK